MRKDDKQARDRRRIKMQAKGTRRLLRYRNFVTPEKSMKFAKQETNSRCEKVSLIEISIQDKFELYGELNF